MTTPSTYLHFTELNNSATFIDEVGKTWTPNANAKIMDYAFYGDGTSWIDTPSNPDFNLGSEDFTIDFWIKVIGDYSEGLAYVLGQCDSSGANASIICTYTSVDVGIAFQVFSGAGASDYYNTNTLYLSPTTWNHIALVNIDGGINIAINGIFVSSVGFGLPVNASSRKWAIGRAGENPSVYFNGYIDDFRISKEALWTDTFIPPERTLAAPVAPSVYLHFTEPDNSTTFTDESGKIWAGHGGAKILDAALYLDGLSWIDTPSNPDFDFSDNGPFTIDFWIKLESSAEMVISSQTNGTIGFFIVTFNPWKLLFGTSEGDLAETPALDSNTWYHAAFVWDGIYEKSYLNGVSSGYPIMDLTLSASTGNLTIGASASSMHGYVDDFRIIKDALWTSDFVPPARTASKYVSSVYPYTIVVA